MGKNIDNKIKAAVSKRLREQKEEQEFIFEGIDLCESKTLGEFFEENDREDYLWEESIEESLYESSDIQGDQDKVFRVGDIIMTTRFSSKGRYYDSPHRILVITSKHEDEETTKYGGFLLSSKVEKANKNGGYPASIYIRDYSTILQRGKSLSKEAFINVENVVTFTNKDLGVSGSWKGAASIDFMRFVNKCYYDFHNGKDTSKTYWEK